MKILSDLENRILIRELSLVTQRNGSAVYQGYSLSQEKVFIKIAKNSAANERYFEILEALTKFPLTPNVLNKFEWEDSSVVVMTAIEGIQADQVLQSCTQVQKRSLFYDIGLTLGKLHHFIPQTNLFNMKCWKNRDGFESHSALWNKHYQVDELRQYDTALCEPSQFTLLHCDYIGRNILVSNDNRISGIIDFEAARIGDPIYDLAKIVWVNMDFSELELRNAFLDGWEYTYKQAVPKRKFLYYVGIQCIAAISWTDTNRSFDGTDTTFRSSAIRTLKIVLNELNSL